MNSVGMAKYHDPAIDSCAHRHPFSRVSSGATGEAGPPAQPGDVYSIPPGHDARVVGDEPVRTIDIAPHGDEATEQAIEAGTEGPAH